MATPGGAGTRHLVNEAVLEAIGPQGALVNIARGSVVDTQALARVLRERRLGAAGIDVYESEPHRPEELIDLTNIVITPHVAGRSPEAVQATVTRFLAIAGALCGRRCCRRSDPVCAKNLYEKCRQPMLGLRQVATF